MYIQAEAERHDAEPGGQQPGEALVVGQAVQVEAGSIQAGEGSNESKQPKQAQDSKRSNRGPRAMTSIQWPRR